MAYAGINRIWRVPQETETSDYVRMIPGRAASDAVSKDGPAMNEGRAAYVRGRNVRKPSFQWTRLLLPQPEAEDRYGLFQSVLADQAVLLATCLLSSFAWPEWGLSGDTIPIYLALVTLFGFSEGVYRHAAQGSLAVLMPGLTKSVLFAVALVFIAAQDDTPFSAFPATLVTSLGGLSAWRYLRIVLWKKQAKAEECARVLIVGAGPSGRAIARALRHPARRTVVRGFLDDHSPLLPHAPGGVLGGIDDLAWLARAEFIDEVIIALPNQPARARAAAEIARRNHLDVRAALDFPLEASSGAGVERIGEIPVVTLHRERQPRLALILKRAVDFAGAVLGLLIAGPLMAVIAIFIRWDSPGRAIYSAPRSGAKGRLFRCYKFRSMVMAADKMKDGLRSRNQRQGPIFKIDDDPRITRVGRWIRRYSLDELPQLWNVLRGDMSLVGPRPHPADEVSHYELQHFRRLDVKPGLTGLWQVTARKDPSFELNMYLDLTYIENWSLLLDLRILLQTVHVLFAPEGC